MNKVLVPEKERARLDITVKIPVPALVYWLCIWPLLVFRRIKYGYSFMRIPLTQGQYTIVDAGDYYNLARYKWSASRFDRVYYAARYPQTRNSQQRQKSVRMHREIMNVSDDRFVDHINHDGLDNRRANLRIATHEQNNWNTRKQRGTYSSRYKGVSWFKRNRRWRAVLRYKGKLKHIGYFDDEKEAAKAYNAKAAEHFGEFASLNNI